MSTFCQFYLYFWVNCSILMLYFDIAKICVIYCVFINVAHVVNEVSSLQKCFINTFLLFSLINLLTVNINYDSAVPFFLRVYYKSSFRFEAILKIKSNQDIIIIIHLVIFHMRNKCDKHLIFSSNTR